MVCFCDIPLGRLGEHVSFYGEYGLGMSKEWGEKNGLCPVAYVNTDSVFSKAIMHVASNAMRSKSGDSLAKGIQMLGFTKPLRGEMFDKRKKRIKKEFYPECEWRYMPPLKSKGGPGVIPEKDFKKKSVLNKWNGHTRQNHLLKFLLDDVKYILVRSEAEVPLMYDFISINLGEHSANSVKRLATRIISLPRLMKDI